MSERLYRSRTDRVFAGVCGGLAERLNVDPSLIRIAWVVLGLLTGVVPFLVLYVVMAVVVPEQPAAEPTGATSEPGTGGAGLPPAGPQVARATSGGLAVVLGAGLVIVGVVFLLDRWLPIRVDWDLLWPAALVVLGIFLIVQSLRRPVA